MAGPIIVVGSVNLDLVATAARLPVPGETVLGRDLARHHGGKGANQAVAAARLGHPVRLVGAVGDDASGPELLAGLETAGVDTALVRTVAGPSGTALITIAEDGANSIVVVPGANAAVSIAQLEAAEGALAEAGMLLAQLEIPLESVAWLAAFARRRGIPLMLDPAPAAPLPAALLGQVAWLTPNESEAAALTGASTSEAAADRLLAAGAANVLLKRGERGCVARTADGGRVALDAFAVEAVDTTAAGDAFNAGFAVALLEARGVAEAARFASAVAALSVTRAGAQPSMPSRAEVDAFFADPINLAPRQVTS